MVFSADNQNTYKISQYAFYSWRNKTEIHSLVDTQHIGMIWWEIMPQK